MLIYFDESYDWDKHWLLLGACFHPHPKFLNRRMTEIKKQYNFTDRNWSLKELKYNNCNNKQTFQVAKECIDAFFESTSYFRLIAVEQWAERFDINKFWFSTDDKKLKMAKIYKKFAELLISHNTENLYNGILFTDELTRCSKDIFFVLMKELFCKQWCSLSADKKEPTLKDIIEVSSHLEQYQLLQITDLLMWCVLNQLKPTKNEYKTNISKYLTSKVRNNLKKEDWKQYSKSYVETFRPKFNIWFWEPLPEKN